MGFLALVNNKRWTWCSEEVDIGNSIVLQPAVVVKDAPDMLQYQIASSQERSVWKLDVDFVG